MKSLHHKVGLTQSYVGCDDFRLKPLDIKFMKSLHHKVNIVPVIAKADMLTPVELSKLKKKVSTRLF